MGNSMRSGSIEKLKSDVTSHKRGATTKPARPSERVMRARQLKIPPSPDKSQAAVEGAPREV